MVKRIDGLLSKESEYLHNPFIPIEIRAGDPVEAFVNCHGSESWKSARVWRYSPFGVELVSSDIHLAKGDNLDLRLKIGKDETLFSGLVVAESYIEQGVGLSGVRLFAKSGIESSDVEKRSSTRWRCSESFLPTGSAANPARFNDYIFFRVEDISATGMKIITSMRNKFLMRGQRLEATMSVPCVGSVQCNFEVKRIDYSNVDEKEFIVLGVEILNRDELILKTLAEYLLQFGDGVTVNSLSKEGFPLSSAYKKFDFTYVKSKDEYSEVLALRFKAYTADGKVKSGAAVGDMADEFDARSRILIVKHDGHIIGSVRIIFHEDSDKLSYGRYFDIPPEGLPDRKDYAEASRMCVDPDYRGADIFYHLAEHMVLTTVKSGRRFIVGGATGLLLEKWEKCGFKRLGINYTSKDIAGIQHELILMDTHEVAMGKGIDLKLWTRVFGKLVVYMLENRLVSPTPLDLIRINGIRALNRLGLF